MKCNCVKEMDAKLGEKNLALNGSFIMPEFKFLLSVACHWVDDDKIPKGKKHSPPSILVSHCPFCGIPVEDKKENP